MFVYKLSIDRGFYYFLKNSFNSQYLQSLIIIPVLEKKYLYMENLEMTKIGKNRWILFNKVCNPNYAIYFSFY